MKASLPGRITAIAPTKPPITVSQRSNDTFSLSATDATSVTIKGLNMTIAVNSPTGMNIRLEKASMLHKSSKRPRTTCNNGLRDAKGAPPWRGTSTRPVNRIWMM